LPSLKFCSQRLLCRFPQEMCRNSRLSPGVRLPRLAGSFAIKPAKRPDEGRKAGIATGQPDLPDAHGRVFEQVPRMTEFQALVIFGRTLTQCRLEGAFEFFNRYAKCRCNVRYPCGTLARSLKLRHGIE